MPKHLHHPTGNKHMDKVKIKRVKRKHKKTTLGEKIIAGMGVASGLSGIGGQVAQSNKPVAVSTKNNENNSRVRKTVEDIFGIQTAKAAEQEEDVILDDGGSVSSEAPESEVVQVPQAETSPSEPETAETITPPEEPENLVSPEPIVYDNVPQPESAPPAAAAEPDSESGDHTFYGYNDNNAIYDETGHLYGNEEEFVAAGGARDFSNVDIRGPMPNPESAANAVTGPQPVIVDNLPQPEPQTASVEPEVVAPMTINGWTTADQTAIEHSDPSDPWFNFFWPNPGEVPGASWWPYDDRNNPDLHAQVSPAQTPIVSPTRIIMDAPNQDGSGGLRTAPGAVAATAVIITKVNLFTTPIDGPGNFRAAIQGQNIESATVFDVRFTDPEGNEAIAENWQTGPTAAHSLKGSAFGIWTITGVRVHGIADFTPVNAAFNNIDYGVKAAPLAKGVIISANSAASKSTGRGFTATFTGDNLTPDTYFDVQFRRPNSTVDEEALNWQKGPIGPHSVALEDQTGTWTITGVRAHSSDMDHSGSYTKTSVAYGISAQVRTIGQAQAIQVTGFNQASFKAGDEVTIKGTGLSAVKSVQLNPGSIATEFISATDTEVKFKLPADLPADKYKINLQISESEGFVAGQELTVTAATSVHLTLVKFMQQQNLPAIGLASSFDKVAGEGQEVFLDLTTDLSGEVLGGNITEENGNRFASVNIYLGDPSNFANSQKIGVMKIGLDQNDNLTGKNQISVYENDPQNFMQLDQNIDMENLTGEIKITQGVGKSVRIVIPKTDEAIIYQNNELWSTLKQVRIEKGNIYSEAGTYVLIYDKDGNLGAAYENETLSKVMQNGLMGGSDIIRQLSANDFSEPTVVAILLFGSDEQKKALTVEKLGEEFDGVVQSYQANNYGFARFGDGSSALFDNKGNLKLFIAPAQPVPIYIMPDPTGQSVSVVFSDPSSGQSVITEQFSSDFKTKLSATGPQVPLPAKIQKFLDQYGELDVLRADNTYTSAHSQAIGDPAKPTGWMAWIGDGVPNVIWVYDAEGNEIGRLDRGIQGNYTFVTSVGGQQTNLDDAVQEAQHAQELADQAEQIARRRAESGLFIPGSQLPNPSTPANPQQGTAPNVTVTIGAPTNAGTPQNPTLSSRSTGSSMTLGQQSTAVFTPQSQTSEAQQAAPSQTVTPRSEAKTAVATLSDKEFLARLYQGVQGRDSDEQGYEFWLNKLEGGMSREAVLSEFINSPEFRGKLGDGSITPEKFVMNMFQVFVGRNPTQAEAETFATSLTSEDSYVNAAGLIIGLNS